MKKKSLISLVAVALVLFILSVTYYYIWNSLANKLKQVVEISLIKNVNEMMDSFGVTELSYEEVKTSGFPFYKNANIKNLVILTKSDGIITKKIKIKDINVFSYAFSKNFDIKLGDIESFDMISNEVNQIKFKILPEVSFSIYGDGKLKSLRYQDGGFNILKSKSSDIAYSTEKTNMEILSKRDSDKIVYRSTANYGSININNNISDSSPFLLFTINFDLSAVLYENKKDTEEIEKFSVNVDNFEFKNINTNSLFKVNGAVHKDISDPFKFYGDLSIKVTGFENFILTARDTAIKELESNKEMDQVYIKQQIEIILNIFSEINRVSQLNSETKDGIVAIDFSRKKDEYDLKVNNQSLLEIFYSLVEKIQTK